MRINTHLQLLTNKKKPKHKNYKWRSKLTLSFWPNSYLPSFSGDVDEHDDSEGDEDSKLTTAFSSLHAASPAGSTRMAVSAPCRPAIPKFSMGGGTLHSPGTGLPLIGCDTEPCPPPYGPGGLALVHIG